LSFSIALAIGVLLSLVLAVTLIPAIAGQWAERERARGTQAASSQHKRSGLSLAGLKKRYARAERSLLMNRRLALIIAGALLVLTFGLSKVIGTGFLPTMDEGGFILDYLTPTGTALAET